MLQNQLLISRLRSVKCGNTVNIIRERIGLQATNFKNILSLVANQIQLTNHKKVAMPRQSRKSKMTSQDSISSAEYEESWAESSFASNRPERAPLKQEENSLRTEPSETAEYQNFHSEDTEDDWLKDELKEEQSVLSSEAESTLPQNTLQAELSLMSAYRDQFSQLDEAQGEELSEQGLRRRMKEIDDTIRGLTNRKNRLKYMLRLKEGNLPDGEAEPVPMKQCKCCNKDISKLCFRCEHIYCKVEDCPRKKKQVLNARMLEKLREKKMSDPEANSKKNRLREKKKHKTAQLSAVEEEEEEWDSSRELSNASPEPQDRPQPKQEPDHSHSDGHSSQAEEDREEIKKEEQEPKEEPSTDTSMNSFLRDLNCNLSLRSDIVEDSISDP